MNGILYFSSTGNSLQIAKQVKQKLGGDIFYIPNYTGTGTEFDKIIIVTPVYSFGMPKHVLDLLPKLDKTKKLIVIQNYGGMMLGADYLFYQYASRLGLNIVAMYKIKMPENFTLVMSPPNFYKKRILKLSENRISKVLDKIINGKYTLPKRKKTHEKTYLKNKDNWHLIGQRFSVTDACIKCGKCADLCPSHNIYLKDGKIAFKDDCVACLGCFHRCPAKAIIYNNKDNKKRYINPNVPENEIGKDL